MERNRVNPLVSWKHGDRNTTDISKETSRREVPTGKKSFPNTRYVLQKAQILPPSLFRVGDKKLSIKTPNDDPSKPALRLNIPKEEGEEQGFSDGLRKSEPGTRVSSIASTFEEDLLQKTETEIPFPKFVSNELLVNGELEKETVNAQPNIEPGPARKNYKYTVPNKVDFTEDSERSLHNESMASSAGQKKYDGHNSYSEARVAEVRAKEAANAGEDNDSKSLYIIIDVPGKEEGKRNVTTLKGETDLEKSKTEVKKSRHEFPLFRGSKSLPRFPFYRPKPERTKKFEINEIEEPATYVFHLKFNRKPVNSSKMGYVPEKEVSTRNEYTHSSDGSIKIPDAAPKGHAISSVKEAASIEDFPKIFRHPSKLKVKKMPETSIRESNDVGRPHTYPQNVQPQPELSGDYEHHQNDPEFSPRVGPELTSQDLRDSGYTKEYQEAIVRPVPAQFRLSRNSPKETFETKSETLSKCLDCNVWPVPGSKSKEESKDDSDSARLEGKTREETKTVEDLTQDAEAEQDRYIETNIPTVFLEKLKKIPPAFEKDDFGTIRTVQKTYPFKIPSKEADEKPEAEAQTQEDSQVSQMEASENLSVEESLQGEEQQNLQQSFEQSPQQNVQQNFEQSPQQNLQQSFEQSPQENLQQNFEQSPQQNLQQSFEQSPQQNLQQSFEQSPQQNLQQSLEQSPQQNLQQSLEQSPHQNAQLGVQGDVPVYAQVQEQDTENPEETDRPPYYSIQDLKENPINPTRGPINVPKKFSANTKSSTDLGKGDSENMNFQTASTCVSIGCEKGSGSSEKFSAAFPPLLAEALKNRFRFRKDTFHEEEPRISLKDSGNFDPCLKSQGNKMAELSENSILFPKKELEKFDCESLFTTREEVIMNLIKNSEEEKTTGKMPKKEDENSSGDCSKPPVDTLTVMKKVKEIVQFDLDNVVKIFHDGVQKLVKEVSSVVVLDNGKWDIDREELKNQEERSEKEMQILVEKKHFKDVFGDKLTDDTNSIKYLPPRENKAEMKLSSDEQSVMTYNPQTNEFSINKDALARAISRRTNEPLSEVDTTLTLLSLECESSTAAKGGDSILVFDEETQSWKVDFSILERRQEQLRLEEELTKRSELILETFEKLEKDQMSKVKLPETGEKKTFNYKREQWDSYQDKKMKEKSKYPFKESDAEEIRKLNSDLYENLFISNKRGNGKNDKAAPALKTPPKKSKPMVLAENKGSNTTEKEGSTPGGPKPRDTTLPSDKPVPENDGNFWETFLNSGILPRDVKELPKITPPPPTPPLPPKPRVPPQQPFIHQPLKAPPHPILPPKKEDIIETPLKKIDEPRFKIRIPFIRDIKEKITDKTDEPAQKTKEGVKEGEPPAKKPPQQPPTAAEPAGGKENKKVSPSSSSQTHTVDQKKKTPPTIGSPRNTEQKTTGRSPTSKVQEPNSKLGGKNDKMASAPDHYVSDKIIEISRNTQQTETQNKVKTNKIETVKLNITADTRLPSKVKEINLSKQGEEKPKETTATQQNPVDAKKPSDNGGKKNVTFHKTFDKYKTPFSDPDYEEKTLKIKSDIDSNPNLKKLDNWNKTLVLHDIMKPSENIESWLKDETDKMATLLLKVLQEAADGKPRRKQPTSKSKIEKQQGKGNPYDSIRKKQENTPDNFLFRVRTVNFSLENDKKAKDGDNVKLTIKSEQLKDIPVQSEKTSKQQKVLEQPGKETAGLGAHGPISLDNGKSKALETTVDSAVMARELSQVATKLPLEITEEIPGPEILKRISNTWKVFPILGSQITIFTLLRVFQLVNLGSSILGSSNPDRSRRHAFSKLFLKYGPIVNVQGPLSGNVILIHAPEHLAGVFEQDITTSIRSVFDSLEHTRRETEETGISVGISTDWSKSEWNDLKRGTIDPLSRGGSKYFGLCSCAADSFVSNIKKNRNSQNFVSDNFMDDIKRWSLEGLCSVIFEKSSGFLEGKLGSPNWIMEPDKLYTAVDEATNCLSKCERGFQMWRLMPTPSATGLGRAYRTMSSILSKQLYQAEVNLKGKNDLLKSGGSLAVKDLTFLESMLLNDGMTTDEVICNLVDIILIGTNAMNSALGFLLYNLAQNVKVQMKLLKELKEVLPNKDSQINYNKIKSLKYLEACLKETLRLHFPVPVFYRLLQNDILLANYIVPKGTFVVMDYRVSSMKEQVFDDPDKFFPERWMASEQWMQNNHPFGAFPLCHGPRADLAKKVVEMHLTACVAKLIRNFHVEYQYGEIQGTDSIISVPDKPLKLNFLEREF